MRIFYSHLPDKELKEHLKEVAVRCSNIISSKKMNNLDLEILSNVSYLIGISHDFGKYTSFFQEHLFYNRNDDLTHHGLISAIFSFYLISEYLASIEENEPYRYIPLIAYFIVKRHHLNLRNLKDDCSFILSNEKNELYNASNQIIDIWQNKEVICKEYSKLIGEFEIDSMQILETIHSTFSGDLLRKKVRKSAISKINNLYRSFSESNTHDFPYFQITMLLFSVLIDSDKKSAGRISEIQRVELPDSIVEVYKKKKFHERKTINEIRDSIYESVLNSVDGLNLDEDKILSITAPTGTGKTLTGFAAALKLRSRLQREKGITPRIIYSLPFTSIIDQNFDVFTDVLNETLNDFSKNPSPYLTKHHYLADIKYDAGGEKKPVEEALSLIESWEAEIIVTTFVQFFHSVIGYRNKALKKFHNIVNSIILLDEIQNIPVKYWLLTSRVLESLATYFNCTIIIMTATKPLLFGENGTVELVTDHETHFKNPKLDRVRIYFRGDMTLQQFEEFLNNRKWEKNSYLFVFNTIKSSVAFFSWAEDTLSYIFEDFIYLSTNIVPKKRKERIERIKSNIKKNVKTIIVTTQLIEAGVDIDVDAVFRDIGPLDSIIQVAGRCNRNSNSEKGEVNIISMLDAENGDRKYSEYIYGPIHLMFSRKALGKYVAGTGLSEMDFPTEIDKYFKEVYERSKSNDTIFRNLTHLIFSGKSTKRGEEETASDFKLIADPAENLENDLFVEIDEEAKGIWLAYIALFEEKDIFKRKLAFLEFKNDFYGYVISVPKKYSWHLNEELYICHISLDELEEYYDVKTGFMRKEVPSSMNIG